MPIKQPIIILSGGTGVGTSKLSLEIAKKLNIPTIVSTDIIRETIRSIISKGINISLDKSKYVVGQTKNYFLKPENVQRTEILRAYKNQSDSVFVALEGIISRGITENIPLIIEGIHLRPGKIKESKFYRSSENCLHDLF